MLFHWIWYEVQNFERCISAPRAPQQIWQQFRTRSRGCSIDWDRWQVSFGNFGDSSGTSLVICDMMIWWYARIFFEKNSELLNFTPYYTHNFSLDRPRSESSRTIRVLPLSVHLFWFFIKIIFFQCSFNFCCINCSCSLFSSSSSVPNFPKLNNRNGIFFT